MAAILLFVFLSLSLFSFLRVVYIRSRCSLVEHLLSVLFEFRAAVRYLLVSVGSGAGPVGILGVALLWHVRLVNDHTLGTNCVLLGRCRCRPVALVAGRGAVDGCSSTIRGRGCFRLLANDVEHTVFQGLLVFGEPVLLPGVVKDAWVQAVPRHAALEEVEAGAVVGLLLKLQGAAVLHVFTELTWMATAELLKRRFDLLLLDVVVLFVL